MIHDRLQCFLNDFWNFVNFIKYPPSGPVLLMDYYLAYYYLSLIYGLLIDILLLLLLPPPPPLPDSQIPRSLQYAHDPPPPPISDSQIPRSPLQYPHDPPPHLLYPTAKSHWWGSLEAK
jgi:hypothetical protein